MINSLFHFCSNEINLKLDAGGYPLRVKKLGSRIVAGGERDEYVFLKLAKSQSGQEISPRIKKCVTKDRLKKRGYIGILEYFLHVK